MENLGVDTVLMPVPLRLAEQVARYVKELKAGGDRDARSSGKAAATVDEGHEVPGQGIWTQAMLNELRDAMPYAGVAALFDRCAETAGTWVMKSEVEESAGISAIQLRNELGALSKLTRRLFGAPTWPMQWKKEQGKYLYRMDDQMGRWWSEAQGVTS